MTKDLLIFPPGTPFGRWTVIGFEGVKDNAGWHLCECSCEAKTRKSIRSMSLHSGASQSCGCLRREKMKSQKNFLKHGKRDTREYNIWVGMKQRCYNPKHTAYEHYGGRGIQVCDRWRESFENFYADMGDSPSPLHEIERMDNDGDYCPENCKWATRLEQNINQRRTKLDWEKVEFIRSSNLSASELAERFGVSTSAIHAVRNFESWVR